MPSLFRIQEETNRQNAQRDDKFWKNFVYFFELQARGETTLFPLVLNPQSVQVSEPFAVTVTPTLDGGLFVEENGVIVRNLNIVGTTGFRPRTLPNGAKYTLGTPKLDKDASFHRRVKTVGDKLSGQRHFQILQDEVFRTYGDLKRNPRTARDTKMFFHNPKDNEHWEVVPQSFVMDRDARKPVSYQYSISLLIVGKSSGIPELKTSEDNSLFSVMKNDILLARNALDNLNATLRDLPRVVLDELDRVVPGLKGAVDVGNLLLVSIPAFGNAISAAVEGGADVIAAPFSTLNRFTRQLNTAVNLLVTAPFRAADTIIQSFRRLEDAFDQFGVHPRLFLTDAQQQLIKERSRQELITSVAQDDLIAAEQRPLNSLSAVDDLGSGLLPGDRGRAQASLGVGRNEPLIRSGRAYVITQGDTLQNLAARFLGDKRLWRQIAVLNGLKAPYLSEQRLPFTLRIGDVILIPSDEPPPSATPTLGIFGVSLDAPVAERVFGADLRLDESDNGAKSVDMAIDLDGGSIDFLLVRGVPNLEQAIRTRLTTEQGTDVLYRLLGYKRVVGIGIQEVDREIVEFRLVEAVESDPRIVGIRAVEFDTSRPDVIDVEMDAEVREFDESVSLQATLR